MLKLSTSNILEGWHKFLEHIRSQRRRELQGRWGVMLGVIVTIEDAVRVRVEEVTKFVGVLNQAARVMVWCRTGRAFRYTAHIFIRFIHRWFLYQFWNVVKNAETSEIFYFLILATSDLKKCMPCRILARPSPRYRDWVVVIGHQSYQAGTMSCHPDRVCVQIWPSITLVHTADCEQEESGCISSLVTYSFLRHRRVAMDPYSQRFSGLGP